VIALPDMSLWEARLRSQVPALRFVGGAADIQAAVDQVIAVPACFLVPASSTSLGVNRMAQVVSQHVEHRVDVALCVRNVNDARGEAALETLNALRPQVISALYAWQPETLLEPIEYNGGQLVNFDDSLLWWVDQYTTRQHFRGGA